MKITVEGEFLQSAHDHDLRFTYLVSIEDKPASKPESYESLIIALVKVASGQGEYLLDRHQQPCESDWQPYIDVLKQLNATQWEVHIVLPVTD